MDNNLIWLAVIVLISFSTQAMSGFGSTILALTLGVHFYPMTGFYLFSGKLTAASVKLVVILFPVIVVGIFLGEWLHHRIDEFRFKIFVFAVLLIAGFSIIMA